MNEQDKRFYFIGLMGAFGIAEIFASVILIPRPNIFVLIGAGQLLAIMLFSEKTKFLKEKVG